MRKYGMIPNHVGDAFLAWEKLFEDWKQKQPEYTAVVGPSEYMDQHGSLKGWKNQAKKNQDISNKLRARFNDEVCPSPPFGPFLDIVG